MTFEQLVSHGGGMAFQEILNTIRDNILWILALVFFIVASWVFETVKLVSGEVPDAKKQDNRLGTLDLLGATLFLSGLIYALLIYPLMWVIPGDVLDVYVPALFAFSFILSQAVFHREELRTGVRISTGLEWMSLSALLYPSLSFISILYPVLLLLGRIGKVRRPLRRVSPYISAIWFGLGFYLGVFPLKAVFFLVPAFLVYLWFLLPLRKWGKH